MNVINRADRPATVNVYYAKDVVGGIPAWSVTLQPGTNAVWKPGTKDRERYLARVSITYSLFDTKTQQIGDLRDSGQWVRIDRTGGQSFKLVSGLDGSSVRGASEAPPTVGSFFDDLVVGNVKRLVTEIAGGQAAADAAIADQATRQRISAAFERDRREFGGAIEQAIKGATALRSDPSFARKLESLQRAVSANDTGAIHTAGLAVMQDPRMGALNYPFASGYDTYVTGFAASAELLVGLDFGRGASMAVDGSNSSTYTSLGPSLGIQAGGSAAWEFGWFKSAPADLGGWATGESASLGAVVGVGTTGWYPMEGDSQIGMTITLGLKVEASAAFKWSHTWVP